MITRNYFVFTRLHDFHRSRKCTDTALTFAFAPSKNLIFQNLSSNCELDWKTKRFDDENLVLALFILYNSHS
jgi:hypothetical protein